MPKGPSEKMETQVFSIVYARLRQFIYAKISFMSMSVSYVPGIYVAWKTVDYWKTALEMCNFEAVAMPTLNTPRLHYYFAL